MTMFKTIFGSYKDFKERPFVFVTHFLEIFFDGLKVKGRLEEIETAALVSGLENLQFSF